MLVYIAGPITGMPNFNKEAFDTAKKFMTSLGYRVLSPSDITLVIDGTWEYYMREALKLMLLCDGIYLLTGWADSKGAKFEHQLALILKMNIMYEAGA